MNILTVVFWQLVQVVFIFALAALESAYGAFSALLPLAPTIVWEMMIILVVLGNLAWMVAAILWGEAGDLPRISPRRAVSAWFFPAPPAARRAAYAQATPRLHRRKIVK
jgi:hypothetical protein